jgi:hypothetical protein
LFCLDLCFFNKFPVGAFCPSSFIKKKIVEAEALACGVPSLGIVGGLLGWALSLFAFFSTNVLLLPS